MRDTEKHANDAAGSGKSDTDGLSRRLVLKGASGVAAATVGMQTLSGAAEAASVELSNDNLVVPVSNDGRFQMRTAGGKDLLFPRFTSVLTIQVDGTNYTSLGVDGEVLGSYLESGTEIINGGQTARTEYLLPGQIRVTQEISLAGEAAAFEIDVVNESSESVEINIRYLFDYQVDNQDGAPIFVDGDVLVTETRFTDPTFDNWKTYDQIPDPQLTGTGTLGTTPTKIEFVAWEDAVDFGYRYERFDPEKDFYTPGENRSPQSDSAGLLYWEEGSVEPNESRTVQTYYGVGEPTTGAEILTQAVEDYRTTVNELLDEFVEARARGSARLYKEYGEEYIRQRSAYWGYRGGVDAADRSDVPDEVREAFDQLFGESINDEYAEQYYQALTEMWDKVDQTDPLEEITAVIADHLRGTADGQENPPGVCEVESYGDDGGGGGQGVLGSTVSTIGSGFNEGVDIAENTINGAIDGAENVGDTTYRTAAGFIKNRERDLRKARLGQRIGGAVTGLINAPGQIDMQVFAAAPVVGVPAGNLGTAIGSLISLPEPSTTAAGLVAGAVLAGIVVGGHVIREENIQPPEIRLPPAFGMSLDHPFNNPAQPKIEEPIPTATPVGPGGPDMLERIAEVISKASDINDAEDVLSQELQIVDLSVGDISEDDVIEKNGEIDVVEASGSITIRNPEDAPSFPVGIVPHLVLEFTNVTRMLQGETISPQIEFTGASVEDSLRPPATGLPAVSPGDTTIPPGSEFEYSFDFEVPYVNAAFESPHVEFYELKMTITSRKFGLGLTSATETFSVGEGIGQSIETIADGSIEEGQSTEVSSTPADESERVTYKLTYGGSDLDLGLYDDAGNHVGLDYETGEFENEIPNATASGPDDGTGSEWIAVNDIGDKAPFDVEVVAIETDSEADAYSVSETETPEIPATLSLGESRVRFTVAPGEQQARTIGVSEVGGFNRLESVSIEVSTLENGGERLDATVSVSDDEFGIEPAGTQPISVTVSVPGDAVGGLYDGEISVSTTAGDDSQSQAIPVTVQVTPPSLPGSEGRPQDVDSDGRFEDINGDGQFDIFDVRTLFNNLDNSTVQTNARSFDFDDSGGDVDIFDVRALFNELQE